MKIEMVTELTPGTVFLEVEAFESGGVFQVNGPYVVVQAPSNGYIPRMWPLASKWWMQVREMRRVQQETFLLSVPSEDGVTITRKSGDHSAFIVHATETERRLREIQSISEEYRAYAIDLYRVCVEKTEGKQ